jgi:hypothetical protein
MNCVINVHYLTANIILKPTGIADFQVWVYERRLLLLLEMNYGVWGSVGIIMDQGTVDIVGVITGVSGNSMFPVYSQ